MSRAKLTMAHNLIQEKRYDQACAILEAMRDNPIAATWLAQIKKSEPEQVDVIVMPSAYKKPTAPYNPIAAARSLIQNHTYYTPKEIGQLALYVVVWLPLVLVALFMLSLLLSL